MSFVIVTPRARAKPLPPDSRKAMIIDAVIPLLIEHGRAVTTRQLADAAGLGEGTIFRAFGDKESLIEAAVARFLDPEPLRAALRAIDPALPLEQKITEILFHMRARMEGVHGMMNALGMVGRPPIRSEPGVLTQIIGQVLAPDLPRLNATPERIIQFVRLIALASSIPGFSTGQDIATTELASLIAYGVAGVPAEGRGSDAS